MVEPGAGDLSGLSLAAIATALAPLRAENALLSEYMARQEAMAGAERARTRMLLQVLPLPLVAVVDLEATIYESSGEAAAYGREIVELGWCLMEPCTGKVLERRSFYIKPSKGFVSPMCTRLTGIQPAQLEQAPSFTEVVAEVCQLHARHGIKVWAAFGHYDRDMLQAQCAADAVAHPWAEQRFFNIQELAVAYFGAGKKGMGLVKALKRAGLDFEGQEHSGVDDAVNAARLLGYMLGR